jgi:cholestenol Delta-isomerase
MGSIMQSINSSSITNHPYYPLEVEIASYLANEWSVPVLLGAFAGVCATVLLATLLTVNKVHPNLRGPEKAAIWWFVLCESSTQHPSLFTDN